MSYTPTDSIKDYTMMHITILLYTVSLSIWKKNNV